MSKYSLGLLKCCCRTEKCTNDCSYSDSPDSPINCKDSKTPLFSKLLSVLRTLCSCISKSIGKALKFFTHERPEFSPEPVSHSQDAPIDSSNNDLTGYFDPLDIKEYVLDEFNIHPSDDEFSFINNSSHALRSPRSCISKATSKVIESFAQEQLKSKPDPYYDIPQFFREYERFIMQAKYPVSYYCEGTTYRSVDSIPMNDRVKYHMDEVRKLKTKGVRSVHPDLVVYYAKIMYIIECAHQNKAEATIGVKRLNTATNDINEYRFHPTDRWSHDGKLIKYQDGLNVLNHIFVNDKLDDITMFTFTLSPFTERMIGSGNPFPTTDFRKHSRDIADARIKLEAEIKRIVADRKLHRGRGRPKKEQPFSTMYTYEAHQSGFLHCNMIINRVLTHKERERLIEYFTNNCGGSRDGIHFGSLCQGYVQHAVYKRYEGIYRSLRNVNRLRNRKNLTYEKEFRQMFRYQFKSLRSSLNAEHSYAQQFAEAVIEFMGKRCNIDYKGIQIFGITGEWHKIAIELRNTPDADKVTEEDLYVTLKVVFTWCDRDKITYQHPDYYEIMKTIEDVKDEGTVLKEREDMTLGKTREELLLEHHSIEFLRKYSLEHGADPKNGIILPTPTWSLEYVHYRDGFQLFDKWLKDSELPDTYNECIEKLYGADFLDVCKQIGIVIPDEYLIPSYQSFKPEKDVYIPVSLPPIRSTVPNIRIRVANGITLPYIKPVSVNMSQVPRVAMSVTQSQPEPEEKPVCNADYWIGITALVPMSQCFQPAKCEC